MEFKKTLVSGGQQTTEESSHDLTSYLDLLKQRIRPLNPTPPNQETQENKTFSSTSPSQEVKNQLKDLTDYIWLLRNRRAPLNPIEPKLKEDSEQ